MLREQFCFHGYAKRDFTANHSTGESAHVGLDWKLADHKLA
jgi:hypothetical protein